MYSFRHSRGMHHSIYEYNGNRKQMKIYFYQLHCRMRLKRFAIHGNCVEFDLNQLLT